mgnify:FL=1
MSKIGNYVVWCEEKGYTDEMGDPEIGHVEEYLAEKPKPVKAFKVDVKWTGTIASFQIEARNAQEAQELANKRLDMESNGLIHFDTKEM